MTTVTAFALLAALLWGLLLARRASVTLTALATILVGYVFGHAFWNLHLGPLPLTLDRLLLAGLAGLLAWRWWSGKLLPARIGGAEWAIAATLVWLTLSALASRPGDDVQLPSSPTWRLLFSFWAPAFLFFAARAVKESSRHSLMLLGGLAALGGYLALTAIAETAGVWALVFPRYIADPDLGLHFGRARGPALNSVSLGIYLTVCLWAAWLLIPRSTRLTKLLLIGLLPLMAAGVLLTSTRSVWLGLVASGAAVFMLQTPRQYRKLAMVAVLGAGVVGGPVAMASLIAMKREDSGHASQHSVQQRTAFAYVSWKMFCDHPLTGVGFGRFYDQKLPYLSDRSQSFELESLRNLHHHNTLLSLLTETGMIGMIGYLGSLGGLLWASWRLADSPVAEDHAGRLGVLSVATITAYLPSAVFHDLSLVHTDQWLVFFVAGAALSFERRLGLQARPSGNALSTDHAPAYSSFATPANS